MDINLIKNTATEGLIKITLKETDYQPKVEEKVKDYSKKASIKGFRPGKVPIGLIKKMFGKSILAEEINALLSTSVNEYVKENKIKLIGEPLPNHDKSESIDWDTQKEFEFEFEVGLIDEFDVKLVQKIKSYEIEPDAKVIDNTLIEIKKQYGNHTEPEEIAAGDDFTGEIMDPNGEKQTVWITSDQVKPKEFKIFIGLKKDDSVKVDLKKAIKDNESLAKILNKSVEEVKKLKGDTDLVITKISRVEKAELNQELFDKVFGKDAVKTEKEFMDKIKETLKQNYNAEAENYTMKLIQDKLLDVTKMDIPRDFYKKWILATSKEELDPAQLDADFDKYLEELKWTLIINKIAEDNDIKAEHAEVVESAKQMIIQQFAAYGMGDNMGDQLDGFADNYLKGNEGQNYYNTFNKVRGDKIMEFIKSKMDISRKKVKPEEFSKIAAN